MVVGSTATDFAAVALVDGVEAGVLASAATGFAALGSAGEFVVVPVDWFADAGCAADGFVDVEVGVAAAWAAVVGVAGDVVVVGAEPSVVVVVGLVVVGDVVVVVGDVVVVVGDAVVVVVGDADVVVGAAVVVVGDAVVVGVAGVVSFATCASLALTSTPSWYAAATSACWGWTAVSTCLPACACWARWTSQAAAYSAEVSGLPSAELESRQ